MIKFEIVLALLLGGAVWVNAQSGGGQTSGGQTSGAQTSGAPADPTQTQDTSSQDATGAVPAATGIDTTTELSENPPVTGLDQPKFERVFIERSYLAPRAEVSQGLDSNFPGIFTSSRAASVTRALGSVELEKLWKVHPLDLNYTAGLADYQGQGSPIYLIQALSATQRFLWRTGQFALRDTFSYLPEGTFALNSYGGEGGFSGGGGLGGLGGGGITGSLGTPGFSNTLFGSIGLQPRIGNMALADVTQYLSPRSSVVLAGGYGLTDFLGTPQVSTSSPFCTPGTQCYFNSNQTSAQLGYDYQISRRDQIGLSLAYEEFHFPGVTAGHIHAEVGQLVFAHRISGKLNFVLGGGPELVNTHETIAFSVPGIITIPLTVSDRFLSGSARVLLTYSVSQRTSFNATYMHFINAGSGVFGGASTDAVHVGVNRAISRTWHMLLAGGYSRSSRLLTASAPIAGNASSYQFGYASGAMRRQLGREFGLFISYQYNSFALGSGYCTTGHCPNSYGRQMALIGVDWTPRPLRLD